MLNFLDKYKFIKGQAAFGVELVFNTKDSYTIIAIELTSNKEGVAVSRKLVDITLEKLKEENTKKLPIYFSVGGKGVIHKKVKADDNAKDQELLNQVLPNASINDFYLQKSLIEGFEYWVSVIRKDVLDNLIKKVKHLNLFGVQIYLGPFVLENTVQLLDKITVLTTSHELIIENNNIIQLDSLGSVSNGEEYHIEGETINSHELIAFGTALSHFIPPNKLISIEAPNVVEIKEEYYHRNKYVMLGFSMLVLFFLITITNMLIGNAYQATNNELQYQVNSKKQFVDELAILREEFNIKEQFVQNSGVTQASKISYYADQIALSIPKSIQLNQLFINPLTKRINKAEDIHFNYNKIKVSGTVTKSISLNNWVKQLKNYEWTNDINIISFVQENLKNAGKFEIEIHIN